MKYYDMFKSLYQISTKFETLRQLLRFSTKIGLFNNVEDYLEQNQKQLENLSLDEAKQVISINLNGSQMNYVIVGNAETQLQRVKGLVTIK